MFDDVAARTRGQVQRVLIQANTFRSDDFVSVLRFQHAILMNARAVREGITSDNRFVQLYRHITQLADQLAGAVNFLMFDVGVQTNQTLAGFQNHGNLFQRGVACPFADAVDGTFDLACAHLHSTNRVRH